MYGLILYIGLATTLCEDLAAATENAQEEGTSLYGLLGPYSCIYNVYIYVYCLTLYNMYIIYRHSLRYGR